ncbi:Tn3 family transposase [Streptomyces sp. NPDC057611]|uniref:Tn3 family transposase n=1 Tax=Streptomyces sp. NPDC057611 TaxID=3346182 RepID=UPI0036A465E2
MRAGQRALPLYHQQIEKVSAHHGNFWEVLLYGQIGRDRAVMFDLAEKLEFTATSEDGRVLDALAHARRHQAARGEYITAFDEMGQEVDISFATQNWRKAACDKTRPSFNRFSQWVGFGNRGVIADNDPVEQEKAMKFNALLTNAVIFHNALDIAEIVRQLLEEGWTIEPEDLAHISPYLTEHINRFGEYSTHELGIQPEAYDPKLDVDFAPLREADPAAAGFGQAA